jgi:fructokinase
MAAGMIVGMGEVLWDLLPTGRQLGGAPFNFTFHCHQLGHPSAIVSRVGADDLGRDIRAAVCAAGVPDRYLQEDPAHPTGTVTVALNEHGHPSYTIHREVAYDYLAWGDDLEELFGQARAVCFGSLVQRHPQARATVERALQAARQAIVVFDVNLRKDCYSREVIEQSLAHSRWVKLNDDELVELQSMLGLSGNTPAELLGELRRRYRLELAALTLGAKGCLVQTDAAEAAVPGEAVRVVDTIGAGDSFTAGLVTAVLEGRPPDEAARRANRLAARVAACAGGTPRIDRRELEG